MDKMKTNVILDNLTKMPIPKGEQSIIYKAVNDNNESKAQKKIIDNAYRYALLMISGTENTSRAKRYLTTLENSCNEYMRLIEKDNCK